MSTTAHADSQLSEFNRTRLGKSTNRPNPKKIPANMNTSAIPGMNHRIILQLAAIAFLAAAGTGTAETITITPDECPLKPVTPVP